MASSSASQAALEAFVTTQLIDNGMDAVAAKINRLYAKLQRAPGDAAAQKKYARQLHHYLTLACRLLARQRDDVSDCIAGVERDLKRGIVDANARAKPPAAPPSSSDEILTPGRHVAAKVARSHELWILARVIGYNHLTRTYEVEDVDTGDDEDEPRDDAGEAARRHHVVPRDQVKALPAETLAGDAWIHYAVNQRVMAMYPNTTSFYRAIVRVPNPKGAPYVLVRFDDDADEFGSHAPDRKIPFRFVVPV